MNGRPTLGLCIPAYRAERHLPALLESAAAQCPPFDEIIVCVDASPDMTADVAIEHGATVLRNAQNVGCSRSKNRAMRAATSDWLHFRDADDVLLPGFTSEAWRWMARDDAPDVVVMGFEYRDFDTKDLLTSDTVDGAELSRDPVAFTIGHKLPNSGIYRRKALLAVGGFDEDPDVLYNEDVAFHVRLALSGCRFGASPTITSTNWRHRGSMSDANPVRCLRAHVAVMRKVGRKANAEYRKLIAGQLWHAATGLASYGQWHDVDEALDAASDLWAGIPEGQSRDFDWLCRAVGPRAAFRAREHFIRLFKPHLRRPLTAEA